MVRSWSQDGSSDGNRDKTAFTTHSFTEEMMDRLLRSPPAWLALLLIVLSSAMAEAQPTPAAGPNFPGEGAEYVRRNDVPKLLVVPARPRVADRTPNLLPTDHEAVQSRSRGLELIAREADSHTRRGFDLAGRKAYYSARAEFIMAIRLLAQALDAEYHTTVHSGALSAGLTAIEEAEDFIPTGSGLEDDLDMPQIIRLHRTPILHDTDTEGMTALAGLGAYFTFAQQQLGTAGGREMAASMALHGLGKLHEVLSLERTSSMRAARSKAMVFYQAALLTCPENYMASNDLGVLLARGGRAEESRFTLEHSLSIREQPAGWRNLAVVYGQLGDFERSHLAERRYQAWMAAQSNAQPSGMPAIQWVDPAAFGRPAVNTRPVELQAARPDPPPQSTSRTTWTPF